MNRPKIVILVSPSVDGRLSLGPNRTMFEEMEDDRQLDNNPWTEIEHKIKMLHHPTADMLGSYSFVKKDEELKELPKFEGDESTLYSDYIPKEILEDENRKGWLIMVDGRGRIRSGFKGTNEEWHTIHLVSEQVSAEYLYFLQKQKIPYVIAGQDQVDLKVALRKLKEECGVTELLHTSGGKLAGAMLREDLIDEVNLIIQPRMIGGTKTPTLFETLDLKEDEHPTELSLISNETLKNGFIWLRYEVKRSV